MLRILLVEDTPNLAESIAIGLAEEGFAREVVGTGRAALEKLREHAIDLVILDLGLPDIDGMTVIEDTRRRGIHCPILVLTARDGVDARVAALAAGADDYLVKPFAFDELVARVRALARRAAGPRWGTLERGSITLTDDLAIVTADRRVALSPKQYGLLAYLLRRECEVVPRSEVLADVFGYSFDPGTNSIDVHLSHLRRKLAGLPVEIETIRGIGFRLVIT